MRAAAIITAFAAGHDFLLPQRRTLANNNRYNVTYTVTHAKQGLRSGGTGFGGTGKGLERGHGVYGTYCI